MAPCSPGRGSFLERSFARVRARALQKPPLSLYTDKQPEEAASLRKVLASFDLTFMGVGGIIGAGVFVLTGSAAREEAGCAVTSIRLIFCAGWLMCAEEINTVYLHHEMVSVQRKSAVWQTCDQQR